MKAQQTEKSVFDAIIFTVLLIIVLLLAWYAIYALLVIFTGILLAIVFYSLTDLIHTYFGIERQTAFYIMLVSLITFLTAGTALLAPLIGEQVIQLVRDIPVSLQAIQNYLNQHFQWTTFLRPLSTEQIQGLLINATSFFSTTLGFFASLVIILFISLYLAYDPSLYKEELLQYIPYKQRGLTRKTLEAMDDALSYWLLGKLCSMLIIGICTLIGLWLLGIPLAITLALIAAFFTFIPNLGPVLALIPAVLVALTQSPIQALYVTIFYTVLQLIETYLITPLIEQRTVRLPPAIILSTQILMGVWTGLLGLALATPLTVILFILIKKVLEIEESDREKQAR